MVPTAPKRVDSMGSIQSNSKVQDGLKIVNQRLQALEQADGLVQQALKHRSRLSQYQRISTLFDDSFTESGWEANSQESSTQRSNTQQQQE